MNLLMLCREPRLYSCQRLKEAAESCGHQIDILDPNRFVLKLSENTPHFELYYQPNRDTEPYLLPDYDGVLPRFGATSTQMGCAVLQHFQAKGVACLNDVEPFLNAREKWRSLQILVQQGIAVPPSLLAGNETQAKQSLELIGSPTILKTLSGSQGIGVILAESQSSASSIVETLNHSGVPVLMQQFIREAQGGDVRCFVVGGKVIATMERKGQAGEFRANIHRGGTGEQVWLSEQEKQIALSATQALGLDVAGVDLIRSQQGLLVLEVNASPGLEMIEKTSGLDIALQMILHLERKSQARSKNNE
ncbi:MULTISPECIES: ATP-grasp domain-containing protein [unclassified Avibacterium]|uniref:ATP-grasp domain-containing protein n=1 Tax=unclassified Avibacterium TaxID=2685287 RepID=UPI0020262E02|nr:MULTISPECIES: RimK family alpha-L-glutamate ligase [unclassified Avibacterium]MCW9698246.1 RimK family alpha-L-glutamate ligase [Avibacterium sp. 20-129]URL07507.1 RimK family alpha-L-glutamate ligase [Avibacterium sp. 21-595]